MLKRIMTWCQGRTTMFAIYFAIVGSVMQWFHHLDMNYVALIAAIQALVLGHSIKEDVIDIKSGQIQQNMDVPQPPPGMPDPRGGQ